MQSIFSVKYIYIYIYNYLLNQPPLSSKKQDWSGTNLLQVGGCSKKSLILPLTINIYNCKIVPSWHAFTKLISYVSYMPAANNEPKKRVINTWIKLYLSAIARIIPSSLFGSRSPEKQWSVIYIKASAAYYKKKPWVKIHNRDRAKRNWAVWDILRKHNKRWEEK